MGVFSTFTRVDSNVCAFSYMFYSPGIYIDGLRFVDTILSVQ